MNTEDSKAQQNNAENKQTDSDSRSISLKPDSETKYPPNTRDKRDHQKQNKFHANWFTFKKNLSSHFFQGIATAILGLANIILVYVVMVQTDINKKQVVMMQQQNIIIKTGIDSTAAQTRESLEIARQQANVAERALAATRIQSAALISSVGIETNPLTAESEFKIIIHLTNSGTPAFDFQTKTILEIIEIKDLDSFMSHPPPQFPARKSGVIFALQQEITRGATIFVTKDDSIAVKSGRKIIVLRIFMGYTDIWGVQQRREIKNTFAPNATGGAVFVFYPPPR